MVFHKVTKKYQLHTETTMAELEHNMEDEALPQGMLVLENASLYIELEAKL